MGNQDETPIGRPVKGLPRVQWNGTLPIDVVDALKAIPAGKRSRLVEKALRENTTLAALIEKRKHRYARYKTEGTHAEDPINE